MKRNIRILGLLIISILLIFSCKKDEIKFVEKSPTGGFEGNEFQYWASYMSEATEDIEVSFEIFGSKESYQLNIALDTSSLDILKNNVVLLQNSVTVTNGKASVDLLQVDFSKLEPSTADSTVADTIILTLTSTNTSLDLESSTKTTMTAIIGKGTIPVLSFSGTYPVYVGAESSDEIPFSIPLVDLLDKPAEQDIVIHYRLNQYYAEEGVNFNVEDPYLRIPAGETSDTLNISVISSSLDRGEVLTLWVEIRADSIPDDLIITRNPDAWWIAVDIGKYFGAYSNSDWVGSYTDGGSFANVIINGDNLEMTINDTITLQFTKADEWGNVTDYEIDPYLVINDSMKYTISIDWGWFWKEGDMIGLGLKYNIEKWNPENEEYEVESDSDLEYYFEKD